MLCPCFVSRWEGGAVARAGLRGVGAVVAAGRKRWKTQIKPVEPAADELQTEGEAWPRNLRSWSPVRRRQ